MLIIALAVILAYLIASFPTAYIIAKLKGKDIFELGSGNMGAMNSFRNLGKIAGIIVFIIDIFKGYLAINLAQYLSPKSVLFALVAVIAGHAWSIFIRFRGGKALAAGFGALLVFKPLFALSIVFALILSILILGKKSNLAVAVILVIYPIATTGYALISKSIDLLCFSLAIFIMALIIGYKHIPGIKQELGNDNIKTASENKSS